MEKGKIKEELETHELLVRIFNMGYGLGHHDTVESQYTDILPVDMDSYHSEIIDQIIENLDPFIPRGMGSTNDNRR